MDDSFKLIAVTLPEFVPHEARLIQYALECGLTRVHVRKPGCTAVQLASLLEEIPENLRHCLSIHDHHELTEIFPDVCIHLNGRNPYLPDGYEGSFSRSCHSFEELEYEPKASYSFLSPIFDSVSKEGYASAFSYEDLKRASDNNIINSKVIALGGVVPERLPILRTLGFGGAAMLGYLWSDLNPENIKNHIDAAIYYSQKR